MAMNESVFAVYDTVAEHVVYFKFAPSAGAFVRDESKRIYQSYPTFEKDFKLLKVAEVRYDDDNMPSFVPCREECSWDSYKFPEVPVEPLPPSDELHSVGL